MDFALSVTTADLILILETLKYDFQDMRVQNQRALHVSEF